MSGNRRRVNAFGRLLDIERVNGQWVAYNKGNEGKRRKASDIVIPSTLKSSELIAYLDDLLHESASEGGSHVVDLDA